MMKSMVLLLTTCTCLVKCLPPPHPDVVAVRQEEELLHPLLRSPALRNPHLLKILPLTSLLHEGEKLVFEREAHDVSRKEIYNILTHAGFIPRRLYPPSSEPIGRKNKPKANRIAFPEEEIEWADTLNFPSHDINDILQYL